MPELPEVETVVRTLAPHVAGQTIVDAQFYSRFVTPGNRSALRRRVAGRTIRGIERRGKFIVITLDEGVLLIHLGMTGKLVIGAPRTAHTHAVFALEDAELMYDDPRQFGRIEWSRELPERVTKLGPEPLEIAFNDFYDRLHTRRRQIKPLLLDQTFLRGLGNIYADEALFRARIHPQAIAAKIGKARGLDLYHAIAEVLRLAIEHGGSSISDYVDAEGNRGYFQMQHQVYGREGQACPRCGRPIRRMVVAQRSAHFCSHCQRR